MLLLKDARICGAESPEPQDILIAGGKIEEIGKGLDYRLNTLEVVDCGGATVIPGYLDQHVHVTGGGGEGGYRNRVPELQLSDIVRGGVTTLVGLLGTDGTARSVENLVAKVKELRDGGVTAYCLTGAYEYPSPTITGSVKRDIVFIEECIGLKMAISDHRCSCPNLEDVVRASAESRLGGVLAGKPGVTHFHVGAGKDGLGILFEIADTKDVPIRFLRPTHLGHRLDEAVAFAERGGFIDFTTGTNTSMTAETVAKALTRVRDTELITISTDAGGSMPKWNDKKQIVGMGVGQVTTMHETVLDLVREQGLPLEQAVKFGAEHVAKALELYPRKGAVAAGSDADLLILDSDLSIRSVIAGGRFLQRDGNILARGVFEQG